jgi:hypothetical protein
MSDFIPNTFQTPNAIVDRLMHLLTDSEFRVLMFTVRHILGWQKKAPTRRASISLSNFENGFSYPTPDGEVSYPGCGLSLPAIRDALKGLQKYRIISAIGKPKAIGQEWELRFMVHDDVDFPGLALRQQSKTLKRKKQTVKARQKNRNHTGGIVEQLGQEGDSLTIPLPDSPTISQGNSPTINNEIHSKDHSKDQKESAATPEIVEKQNKTERNAWYDAIADVWGYQAGRNINMQKFLQGTCKGKPTDDYVKYQLPPDNKLTPDGLRVWAKSYRGNNPGAKILEKLEKVQSSILLFLEQNKPAQREIIHLEQLPDNSEFMRQFMALPKVAGK